MHLNWTHVGGKGRSISVLMKSTVQMYYIYCCFSSVTPSSIPVYYSRPRGFREYSVSIQPTSVDFRRTGHESKLWLFFIQEKAWSEIDYFILGWGQGLKSKGQDPQKVERNTSQVNSTLLFSLRYLSPHSHPVSELSLAFGWALLLKLLILSQLCMKLLL